MGAPRLQRTDEIWSEPPPADALRSNPDGDEFHTTPSCKNPMVIRARTRRQRICSCCVRFPERRRKQNTWPSSKRSARVPGGWQGVLFCRRHGHVDRLTYRVRAEAGGGANRIATPLRPGLSRAAIAAASVRSLNRVRLPVHSR